MGGGSYSVEGSYIPNYAVVDECDMDNKQSFSDLIRKMTLESGGMKFQGTSGNTKIRKIRCRNAFCNYYTYN